MELPGPPGMPPPIPPNPPTEHSPSTWSLTEMCGSHLKIQREDIDPEDTHSYFDHTLSGPEKLVKFIRLCEVDAFFQMAIAHRVQMLPLTTPHC